MVKLRNKKNGRTIEVDDATAKKLSTNPTLKNKFVFPKSLRTEKTVPAPSGVKKKGE